MLQQDATSTTVARAVAAEQALGRAVEVRGTPSVFVNGRILINRSPEGFRAAIDSLLAARGASDAPAPAPTTQPDLGAAGTESAGSLRTDPAPVAEFDVLGITLRSKASDIHHQFRPNDPLPTPNPGRKPVPSNYRGTFGEIETYFTDADELFCLSRTQQFREGSQATFSRTRDALLAKYGPPNSFVQERNDQGEVNASHFVWIAEPSLLANSNCVHIHSAAPDVPRDGALVSGCAFLKVSLRTEPVADTHVVSSITTYLASHDVGLEQAARRREVRDEKDLERRRDAENTDAPTL